MKLHTLVETLEANNLVVSKKNVSMGVAITHLAQDSRKAMEGGLFTAIRGEVTDGHLFIEKAVQNGVVAIVCEAIPEAIKTSGIALIKVSQARKAWALLNRTFYGNPANQLALIGVTGTNGKTTTTTLTHQLFQMLGVKAGLVGTIDYKIGNQGLPSTHTTPDTQQLNELYLKMIQANCKACVMEVSSHALAQDRVFGQSFKGGIFTNITRDHLDFHGSFEAYLQAKKILFDQVAPEGFALINADDEASHKLVPDTQAQVFSYGQKNTADFKIEVLANQIEGLFLRIDGIEKQFKLVGDFNAYNLGATYGIARLMGFDAEETLNTLATMTPVAGRFEQIRFESGLSVIVDYAHTPDALENVLKTMQSVKHGTSKIWCVFGCGGNRDAGKRPIMGSIAETYSDHVVVTSDNPRTENPTQILLDIRKGFKHPERATWIINRQEAIVYALHQASPKDLVLVAGKGHEPYQVLGTETIHFDDKEEAIEAMKQQNIALA